AGQGIAARVPPYPRGNSAPAGTPVGGRPPLRGGLPAERHLHYCLCRVTLATETALMLLLLRLWLTSTFCTLTSTSKRLGAIRSSSWVIRKRFVRGGGVCSA